MSTTKKSVGRPGHLPTPESRRQVEALASSGTTYELIARVVDISVPTLTKHYADILEVAAAKANAMIAQSLYRRALSNDKGAIVAAIFWLKSRAGWRDHGPVDPFGVGAIVDALAEVGIGSDDDKLAHKGRMRVIGISQGWKLSGAIKTAERKLSDGTLLHAEQPLMDWCVGNPCPL